VLLIFWTPPILEHAFFTYAKSPFSIGGWLGSSIRPDMSYVETGQKLIEVVELMEWAEALGFDARDAIKALARIRK
jgi:hypothetical protein